VPRLKDAVKALKLLISTVEPTKGSFTNRSRDSLLTPF
jgi:hypothetical protein